MLLQVFATGEKEKRILPNLNEAVKTDPRILDFSTCRPCKNELQDSFHQGRISALFNAVKKDKILPNEGAWLKTAGFEGKKFSDLSKSDQEIAVLRYYCACLRFVNDSVVRENQIRELNTSMFGSPSEYTANMATAVFILSQGDLSLRGVFSDKPLLNALNSLKEGTRSYAPGEQLATDFVRLLIDNKYGEMRGSGAKEKEIEKLASQILELTGFYSGKKLELRKKEFHAETVKDIVNYPDEIISSLFAKNDDGTYSIDLSLLRHVREGLAEKLNEAKEELKAELEKAKEDEKAQVEKRWKWVIEEIQYYSSRLDKFLRYFLEQPKSSGNGPALKKFTLQELVYGKQMSLVADSIQYQREMEALFLSGKSYRDASNIVTNYSGGLPFSSHMKLSLEGYEVLGKFEGPETEAQRFHAISETDVRRYMGDELFNRLLEKASSPDSTTSELAKQAILAARVYFNMKRYGANQSQDERMFRDNLSGKMIVLGLD